MKLKLPDLRNRTAKDTHAPCPARSDEQATLRCPLCGNEFAPKEAYTCQACPKLLRCKLIMCPRCFYEFPPQ
jgi:hypothetical protein